MHMADPADQDVLLMYELKGAHWAVTCLLLVSGWRVFPPFEEMALILKLLYFSSLISVFQGKSLSDPSLCGCISCLGFLHVVEVEFTFFLVGARAVPSLRDPPTSLKGMRKRVKCHLLGCSKALGRRGPKIPHILLWVSDLIYLLLL